VAYRLLDPIGGKGFGRNFAMLAPLGMVIFYGRLDGPPDPDFVSAMRAHSGKSPPARLFARDRSGGRVIVPSEASQRSVTRRHRFPRGSCAGVDVHNR
jgi:hypothetical protein